MIQGSLIYSAEDQLRQILEEYFVTVYDTEFLSSHGLDHHRRVWFNARELLTSLDENHISPEALNPCELIVACYLHDIGMAVDHGIKHGRLSREICIRFLSYYHLNESEFSQALSAIEFHDDKEYRTKSAGYDLLKILSVADDLDAFGLTGVFRYAEIYLARGINPAELGRRVIDNARIRFENFTASFAFSEKLIQKHNRRYNDLLTFFNKFNEEAESYLFGGENPAGYCGVIDIFISMIHEKKSLKEILNRKEQFAGDDVMNTFFNRLSMELLPYSIE